MARNPPPGDGHRIGAVRERSQTFNPHTERWVKPQYRKRQIHRPEGRPEAVQRRDQGEVSFVGVQRTCFT